MDAIDRREASSGKVSYSDPVVLHETSKTRVVMIPFFIRHSDHTELAVKMVTYRKSPSPNDWAVVEDKSLSLKEPAARKLLESLRSHLAVSEQDHDGNFLVIRVSQGTADIGKHDPKTVATALTNVLSQKDILTHLVNVNLSEEFIRAFRGAIRLKEMLLAVTQLREYLENGETSEQIYQDWCDAHTWAFGNAYVVRDKVRAISAGDKLDMLLPSVISGYRDLVELKRPDMTVLNWDDAHENYYFAAETSKALGQCHRYLDVLHEVAANGLRDHPEIVAYHPRAILIIGRSNKWDAQKLRALHGLNRRLSGITVMTYDQLLAQGERLIETVSAATLSSELNDDEDEAAWDDPF